MIYHLRSYRKIIEEIYKAYRAPGLEKKPSWAQLARTCQMQPSYLSSVLKGRAELNTDQAYALASALNTDSEATEYLLLVLELERSQNKARRKILEAKVEAITSAKSKEKKALPIEAPRLTLQDESNYYLDPYVHLIHMYFTIPAYAKNPSRIAQSLRMTEEALSKKLAVLEKLGILARNPRGVLTLTEKSRHLPDDSPLVRAHQSSVKAISLERSQRERTTASRFASISFSADPKSYEQIQKELHEFLGRCKKIVDAADPTEVYQLNLDLFPWGE